MAHITGIGGLFFKSADPKSVMIIGRDDSDPHGCFVWIVDPDGTKIEL